MDRGPLDGRQLHGAALFGCTFLLASLLIACSGATGTASTAAPIGSDLPIASGLLVDVTPRAIRSVASLLLEPLALDGLASDGGTAIVSDSGERRWIERLVDVRGHERLVVATTLSGAIRSVQRIGVPLSAASGIVLSKAALILRASNHLAALGIATPSGAPSVLAIAGRKIVNWNRRVGGVLVPGDGTRLVLALDGALVGLAIESAPLAAAPSQPHTASAAIAAATKLLPNGATLDGSATLVWVAPSIGGGDEEDLDAPRRLAWRIRGALSDGSAFGVDLDAGSLVLLGWDWAR